MFRGGSCYHNAALSGDAPPTRLSARLIVACTYYILVPRSASAVEEREAFPGPLQCDGSVDGCRGGDTRDLRKGCAIVGHGDQTPAICADRAHADLDL